VSSNTSPLEAHAGFFKLLLKGIFDPYVLWPFDKKMFFRLVTLIRTCDYTVFRISNFEEYLVQGNMKYLGPFFIHWENPGMKWRHIWFNSMETNFKCRRLLYQRQIYTKKRWILWWKWWSYSCCWLGRKWCNNYHVQKTHKFRRHSYRQQFWINYNIDLGTWTTWPQLLCRWCIEISWKKQRC